MMKRFMVLVITLLPGAMLAQSYHRLAARDFTATPPPNSPDIAYTNCYVGYTYDASRHNGNYFINFNIRLTLNNNKSFIRLNQVQSQEHLQQILRHEQGHYNLAFLLKSEAYSVLSRYHYTANYQAEIANLFKQVETKYLRLNQQYETETNNMRNTQNQEKWNAWFASQITALNVYASDL